MSLFPHGGEVGLSAGQISGPAQGGLLQSFGRPLLSNGGMSDNILPAQCCNAASLANNGPSQNYNGALLYNNAAPLPCAAALLFRAAALLSGMTPVQCNGGTLQVSGRALPNDIGAKLSSTTAQERNDALPHEGRALFLPYFTDAVHSKVESSILCPMQKQ